MRGARARLQARVVRLREAVCLCRCDGFLRPPGGSTKASDGSAPGPTGQRERAGVPRAHWAVAATILGVSGTRAQ